MFTGIIEDVAEVVSLKKEDGNLHISFKSRITNELKIDQSISHNGVCFIIRVSTCTAYKNWDIST